ncbi:MAG: hypothetical protein WAN36_12745, partial [Calditrichia bacterium]
MIRIFHLLNLSLITLSIFSRISFPQSGKSGSLAVSFTDGHGQAEVGGKYVGAEFHQSRPLFSRLSFYYPVANSLDLSTDYWKRDESLPFQVVVTANGRPDTVGLEAFEYRYAPYFIEFHKAFPDYSLTFSYHFCEDLPVMALALTVKNTADSLVEYAVKTSLTPILRTCQTYAWKIEPVCRFSADGRIFAADFKDAETDSTTLFILNAGAASQISNISKSREIPAAEFS